MQIELTVFGAPSCPDGELDFDPEFDDARSLIGSVCRLLHDSEVANFLVSGFGDERWPVDVFADLPTFLEQIPVGLKAIEVASNEFDIEFYEQGIERTISFRRANDVYEMSCQSLTNWQPSTGETMSVSGLRDLFESVRNEFMKSTLGVPMTSKARGVLDEWADMGSVPS